MVPRRFFRVALCISHSHLIDMSGKVTAGRSYMDR